MCNQKYVCVRPNNGSLCVNVGPLQNWNVIPATLYYCAKIYCLVKPWEEWVRDRILSSVFTWELPPNEDIGPYETYYSQRAIFSKRDLIGGMSGEFLLGGMWRILIADNPPGTEHILRDKLLQSKVDKGQTVQLKEWQASLVISLSNNV